MMRGGCVSGEVRVQWGGRWREERKGDDYKREKTYAGEELLKVLVPSQVRAVPGVAISDGYRSNVVPPYIPVLVEIFAHSCSSIADSDDVYFILGRRARDRFHQMKVKDCFDMCFNIFLPRDAVDLCADARRLMDRALSLLCMP